MADTLVWVDGFDYYTSSEITRRYLSGTTSAFVSGRFGGQACRIAASSGSFVSSFTTSQSWLVGFALYIASSSSDYNIVTLRDNGTNQVGVTVKNSSRRLQFNRNGTLIGSEGTTSLSLNTWYWIEVYFTVKDSISSGECQIYLNGSQEVNLAAASDTKNTANAYADQVAFLGASFWDCYFDDLFIYQKDTTTTPTFVGERRVVTLRPNGNGNYSEFTGSDGNSTDNYLLVDETTTNDSDYVESDVSGEKDSYTVENFAATPSEITAVQISSQLRKDDAGARTGRLFSRISGTDYEGSDITPSSSFTIKTHLMTTSPATASAWTASEVNGMEVGIKVQS